MGIDPLRTAILTGVLGGIAVGLACLIYLPKGRKRTLVALFCGLAAGPSSSSIIFAGCCTATKTYHAPPRTNAPANPAANPSASVPAIFRSRDHQNGIA
jgi:hypothetical protein